MPVSGRVITPRSSVADVATSTGATSPGADAPQPIVLAVKRRARSGPLGAATQWRELLAPWDGSAVVGGRRRATARFGDGDACNSKVGCAAVRSAGCGRTCAFVWIFGLGICTASDTTAGRPGGFCRCVSAVRVRRSAPETQRCAVTQRIDRAGRCCSLRRGRSGGGKRAGRRGKQSGLRRESSGQGSR
eukprot:359108-Chlamydomonas_euryale.AAC.6